MFGAVVGLLDIVTSTVISVDGVVVVGESVVGVDVVSVCAVVDVKDGSIDGLRVGMAVGMVTVGFAVVGPDVDGVSVGLPVG